MKWSREALLRAVLSNVETWADDLRAAPADPNPWGSVQHTVAGMDQAAAMLRRTLARLPPEDTEEDTGP